MENYNQSVVLRKYSPTEELSTRNFYEMSPSPVSTASTPLAESSSDNQTLEPNSRSITHNGDTNKSFVSDAENVHDNNGTADRDESPSSSEVLSTSLSDSNLASDIEVGKKAPFKITWSNLSYFVRSRWYELADQKKFILNSLDGCFRSGHLSAILGPSGAGKSTLVNCLLNKIDDKHSMSGTTQVQFDGSSQGRQLKIAIIPQHDHLLDTLTVEETFMFASKLKNAHLNWTTREHEKNVSRVLGQLSMITCRDVYCSQLSGGQYKRCNIGQELLSNPDIMILDEPTSGLDAVTCYETVSVLRQLIEDNPNPMCIIAIVHQPDREVFDLFHHIYVLANGGRCIYEGPNEMIEPTIQQALKMANFKATDTGLQIGQNPARSLVECAAHKHGYALVSVLNLLQKQAHQQLTTTKSQSLLTQNLSYQSSQSSVDNNKMVTRIDLAPYNDQMQVQPIAQGAASPYPVYQKARIDKRLSLRHSDNSHNGCFFKHLYYHTHRSWVTITRDPMLFTLQVILHIGVPLLISYTFQGKQPDGCPRVGPVDLVETAYSSDDVLEEIQSQVRRTMENVSYLFFQQYVIIFSAICMTSLTYPLAAQVLLSEYRNSWYNISTYYIGRTLADMPITASLGALAIGISYHLTDQPWSPYDWRFICVAVLTVLCNMTAQTQGLLFGALLMNHLSSATFAAPASTAPLIIVAGFLVRVKLMPWILQILSEWSYFTHLLRGLVISIYGYGRCECDPQDFELEPDHQLPNSARNMIGIWIDTFRYTYFPNDTDTNATIGNTDIMDKIVNSVSRARSFGYNITNCDELKPFPMLDFEVSDSDLIVSFAALAAMLVAFRVLTFLILSWKIRSLV